MKSRGFRAARFLGLAAALAAVPCPGALVIFNGGFESSTNIVARQNTHAESAQTGQWSRSDQGFHATTNGNPGGHLASTTGSDSNGRGFVYIINDNSESTGEWILSFDWQSLVNDASANNFQVGIFGVDEGETNSSGFTGEFQVNAGNIGMTRPANSATLFTGVTDYVTITSSADDITWTNFSRVFDLGTNGYEYIGIHFRFVGYNGANDAFPDLNRVGIDNVTISAIPEPATLALLFAGSGLLLIRRRR